uniref:ras-related protein Rab-32-like isoform X1 n=1 Tax=Myxine glutinosa TaxID=7769 RepID=UPI00358EDE3E
MGPRAAEEKKEYLYKILVIGDLGVGKTSIIKRYVHQLFSQNYRATIGVDFALKVLHWDSETTIRLQLWDIAGQERFGNMTRVYYKEAVGALVVFDITRSTTFEAIAKWKHDLDSKVSLPSGATIPTVLLANKCDQGWTNGSGVAIGPNSNPGDGSHAALLNQFCREHEFVGWFETSAKENINIEQAARLLVQHIMALDQGKAGQPSDAHRIRLESPPVHTRHSKCCGN